MAAEQRADPAEDLLPEPVLQASVPQTLHEVETGGRRKVITRNGQAMQASYVRLSRSYDSIVTVC
jgi:hypothetical protein